MNNIGHVRIDDRLIHGQIVASWISFLNCNEILVADDKAAGDEFQKMLLKMACPDSIEFHVLEVKEAANYLINSQNREKTLCIVRNAENALKLVESADVGIDKINVGNVSTGKDRQKYTKSVWLNDNDIQGFKKLAQKGIELEIRVIPSEKATDLMSLIK